MINNKLLLIKEVLLENIIVLRKVLEQTKDKNDKLIILHLKFNIDSYFDIYRCELK